MSAAQMGKDIVPKSEDFSRHPLFLKVLGRYPDCPDPPVPPAVAEHWDESDFEMFVASMGAIVPQGSPKKEADMHGTHLARGRDGVAHVAKKLQPPTRPVAEHGPGRPHEALVADHRPGRQQKASTDVSVANPRLVVCTSPRRCPAAGSKSILRVPGPVSPGDPLTRPPQIKRSVSFSEVVEEQAADPANLESEGRSRGGLADPRCVLAVLAMLVALVSTDAELQAAFSGGGLSAAAERLPAVGQMLLSESLSKGIAPYVAMLVVALQVLLFAALLR